MFSSFAKGITDNSKHDFISQKCRIGILILNATYCIKDYFIILADMFPCIFEIAKIGTFH